MNIYCPDCNVKMGEYDGGDHVAVDGYLCPDCGSYWPDEELRWMANQPDTDEEYNDLVRSSDHGLVDGDYEGGH